MKKKQTHAEKKAARKAKLNPANHKTAKDVADERDRKRRLEDEEAERAAAGIEGPIERPGQGIKLPAKKKQKTAKTQDVHAKAKKEAKVLNPANGSDNAQPAAAESKEERRRAKEHLRKEKKAMKAAKEAKKKATKKEKSKASTESLRRADDDTKADDHDGEDEVAEAEEEEEEEEVDEADEEDQHDHDFVDEETAEMRIPADEMETDMDNLDVSGLVDEPSKGRASSSRSSSPAPEFSPYHNDRSSSTSSIPTPSDVEELRKVTKQKQTLDSHSSDKSQKSKKHETAEEVKARKAAQLARLQELIEAKRAARNADGLNGKPARSRSELIEARRQKEQEKKEKKKELRTQEREAQKKAEMEAHLASLRGSPALGAEIFSRSRSASVSSPGVNANNFSFGRVAFADGSRMNSSLSGLVEQTKKFKGPSDAKTALLAAEKHQAHLNNLDEAKRAELMEKDIWLNARKRISGEKIRDDVSLLKKSLKRKDKAKSKSEREWTERTEGVKKSQEARQKKREENIAKRKEEKGGKGKKGGTGPGIKKKVFKPRKKGF